jgi:protein-S-isoprenylcysteine O-methyltransferase Ste14
VALAYLVVRHPSLLHSLLADLAMQLGLPVAAVQTAGWFLIVLPLIYLIYHLLRPLAFLLIWSGTRLRSLVVRPT